MSDVVDAVQSSETDSQEGDHEAEFHIEWIGHGFEATPLAYPSADNRCTEIGHSILVHHEWRTGEEGAYRRTDEQRSENSIEHQEDAEGILPKDIARLALEFVRHGLEHEGDEDGYPHPIGTAEASTVEQGEGSEECTAECHESSEGQLPFPTGGVHEELALFFGSSG